MFIAPNGIIKPLIKSIMIVCKTYKNYNIQTEKRVLKGTVDVFTIYRCLIKKAFDIQYLLFEN